jgi:aspartyl-tRNA(Asn)/glutamyl-tRNA(Gln) amidotransferase subunit B
LEYEPVIGLEVHAQLLTASKLFCGCSTEFGSAPNTHVCPVCLGLPGALPVINREAVAMAVRAALALDCRLRSPSLFARKNYFYPDLPKGYQISQYESPFSERGQLRIETPEGTKRIGITRIHMEEDAGKTVHGVGSDSIVDLNRAGVPLIEIVSEPELGSSKEAANYLRALREILLFIGVNDGNLEEGSFRCDANVSIRPRGSKALGTRAELKNLNSFRFVERAIDAEVVRQTAVLGGGGRVEQETRAFNPDTGRTRTLRSKEDAHDYRYFPDPDLPPLMLAESLIAAERERMTMLPRAVRERYERELGLGAAAAQTLTQHPAYVRFFETVLARSGDAQRAANWVLTEVLRGVELRGLEAVFPVSPEQVGELLILVESGRITGKQSKDVYAAMVGTSDPPSRIVEARGLEVVGDESELMPLCKRLVSEHPKQASAVRAGKKAVLGFFIGQVMKETGGNADPKLVSELFQKLLSEGRE